MLACHRDPDKSYQRRSLEEIEQLVASARRRETYYYGKTDEWLYAALDRYPIQGLRVLIMGEPLKLREQTG